MRLVYDDYMPLSQEELKKIGEELDKRIKKVRGGDLVCPACKNTNFQLIDAYTRRDLSDKINEVKLGGEEYTKHNCNLQQLWLCT